jgi:hypothetical protein
MAEWRSEDVPSTGMLHTAAGGHHDAAWAFGISVPNGDAEFVTLIFRRTGQGWEQVEAPQIGRVNRALATSGADVWAVGDGSSLHWDGSGWQKVPTAVIQGSEPQFFGLAQFGGDDVWTAGYAPSRDYRQARGTVQHWDGAAWTDLPLPAVAPEWSLWGIAGASPADLWAVGQVHGTPGEALALHWDGQEWQRVPMPAIEGRFIHLSDVAVLGSGDTWAVGYSEDHGDMQARQPFTAHWDGHEWSPGEIPNGSGEIMQLVTGGGRIWGLGDALDGVPYVATLEGPSWQLVPGPAGPPEATRTSLHGGAVLSDGSLLAVGASSTPNDSPRPLAAVLTSHP